MIVADFRRRTRDLFNEWGTVRADCLKELASNNRDLRATLRRNDNFMCRLCLGFGSWILAFGFLTVTGAEAGSIHVRYGVDAPERLATSNVRLYESVVADRDLAPVKFDESHPFYGRLLTDPTFADRLIHRWEGHEQRFEYWHNELWRILDGMAQLHQPSSTDPQLPISPPPSSDSSGPPASTGEMPASPASTPEPSTWVMMVSGFVFVGLAIFRNRMSNLRVMVESGAA